MNGWDTLCRRVWVLRGNLSGLIINIVLGIFLTNVVAVSASAQSFDPSVGSGNLNAAGFPTHSPTPIRRVGKLQCDLDTDCQREELVSPMTPNPRKRR
jgi:hypothetical protein